LGKQATKTVVVTAKSSVPSTTISHPASICKEFATSEWINITGGSFTDASFTDAIDDQTELVFYLID
jgi:hypothetical protein